MIHGVTGHVEKIKRHNDFMGSVQEHPVDHKSEVVSRAGQNMKDKLLHKFGEDVESKSIYTRHPGMTDTISPKHKGAENREKSEDTHIA